MARIVFGRGRNISGNMSGCLNGNAYIFNSGISGNIESERSSLPTWESLLHRKQKPVATGYSTTGNSVDNLEQ